MRFRDFFGKPARDTNGDKKQLPDDVEAVVLGFRMDIGHCHAEDDQPGHFHIDFKVPDADMDNFMANMFAPGIEQALWANVKGGAPADGEPGSSFDNPLIVNTK